MARFLAMAKLKQAWLCSFGLTKTFVYSLSKSRCELGVPMKIALAYSSPPRHQQNPLSNRNSLGTQSGYSPAKVQSYFFQAD